MPKVGTDVTGAFTPLNAIFTVNRHALSLGTSNLACARSTDSTLLKTAPWNRESIAVYSFAVGYPDRTRAQAESCVRGSGDEAPLSSNVSRSSPAIADRETNVCRRSKSLDRDLSFEDLHDRPGLLYFRQRGPNGLLTGLESSPITSAGNGI